MRRFRDGRDDPSGPSLEIWCRGNGRYPDTTRRARNAVAVGGALSRIDFQTVTLRVEGRGLRPAIGGRLDGHDGSQRAARIRVPGWDVALPLARARLDRNRIEC